MFSFSTTLDCSTLSELIEESDRAINIASEGEYLRLLLKFAWRSNEETDADKITQIGMGHIATITKMGVYISTMAKATRNTFLQNRRQRNLSIRTSDSAVEESRAEVVEYCMVVV